MFQNAGVKEAVARPFKPLPPIITKQKSAPALNHVEHLMSSIDRPLREHLSALVQMWLVHANLPSSLSDTLISTLLPLVRSWLDGEQDVTVVDTASSSSIFDSIFIQVLNIKSMNDSRFLPGVYHGDPMSSISGKCR